jgi:hypothetical protein
MGNFKVPDLVELLQATLLGIEASEAFKADDHVCIDFRRNVLRMIANLQVVRARAE